MSPPWEWQVSGRSAHGTAGAFRGPLLAGRAGPTGRGAARLRQGACAGGLASEHARRAATAAWLRPALMDPSRGTRPPRGALVGQRARSAPAAPSRAFLAGVPVGVKLGGEHEAPDLPGLATNDPSSTVCRP